MKSDPETPAGLYIHIPFCVKKCLYCDFYSCVDLAEAGLYTAALKREMKLSGPSSLAFDTLYIGGGTPSVLDAAAIEQIIAAAFRHFDIRSDAEITVEVNPGTVTLDGLRRYRQSGVNRLNIGVQSFLEENLKFLGRIHSSEKAQSTIGWARQAGFDNIGLDLIYGLPEQDEYRWLDDLDRALKISPEHLSCYILTRESGTLLDEEMHAGRIRLPAEDRLLRLFNATIDHLTNSGFLHYEVSNFARKANHACSPWKSRHNQKYWSFAPYIGLGPSAHSYQAPERFWNYRDIEKYLQAIGQDQLPIAGKEKLTREQMIIEAVYLGFRTTQGIDLNDFRNRFGIDFLQTFRDPLDRFANQELLAVAKNHCRLTRKGMVLLDSITAAFIL